MSNGNTPQSGDVNLGGSTPTVTVTQDPLAPSLVIASDQGPPGIRGNSVLNGTSNPVGTVGIDGDFYINITTNYMWGPKGQVTSGSWPTQGFPLQGAQGPPGVGIQGPPGQNGNTLLNGTGAPTNAVGNNGDFYLDTAGSVMYGPKANNVWPATGTSVIGPPGPVGPLGGTFPDAPSDGKTYGRMNAVWNSIVPDAPNDGTLYGRKSQAWSSVPPPGIADAPNDGNLYGRKSQAWSPATVLPSGSVMLFLQATAPTGWTRSAAYDDALLRLVGSGAPGSGGSNGFVATYNNVSAVGGTTLSVAGTPSHVHTLAGGDSGPIGVPNTPVSIYCVQSNGSANSTGTLPTGGGASHAHALVRSIKYVDALVAAKN
jgi:hypothetical protein